MEPIKKKGLPPLTLPGRLPSSALPSISRKKNEKKKALNNERDKKVNLLLDEILKFINKLNTYQIDYKKKQIDDFQNQIKTLDITPMQIRTNINYKNLILLNLLLEDSKNENNNNNDTIKGKLLSLHNLFNDTNNNNTIDEKINLYIKKLGKSNSGKSNSGRRNSGRRNNIRKTKKNPNNNPSQTRQTKNELEDLLKKEFTNLEFEAIRTEISNKDQPLHEDLYAKRLEKTPGTRKPHPPPPINPNPNPNPKTQRKPSSTASTDDNTFYVYTTGLADLDVRENWDKNMRNTVLSMIASNKNIKNIVIEHYDKHGPSETQRQKFKDELENIVNNDVKYQPKPNDLTITSETIPEYLNFEVIEKYKKKYQHIVIDCAHVLDYLESGKTKINGGYGETNTGKEFEHIKSIYLWYGNTSLIGNSHLFEFDEDRNVITFIDKMFDLGYNNYKHSSNITLSHNPGETLTEIINDSKKLCIKKIGDKTSSIFFKNNEKYDSELEINILIKLYEYIFEGLFDDTLSYTLYISEILYDTVLAKHCDKRQKQTKTKEPQIYPEVITTKVNHLTRRREPVAQFSKKNANKNPSITIKNLPAKHVKSINRSSRPASILSNFFTNTTKPIGDTTKPIGGETYQEYQNRVKGLDYRRQLGLGSTRPPTSHSSRKKEYFVGFMRHGIRFDNNLKLSDEIFKLLSTTLWSDFKTRPYDTPLNLLNKAEYDILDKQYDTYVFADNLDKSAEIHKFKKSSEESTILLESSLREIMFANNKLDFKFDVIVSSPFRRCWQTALFMTNVLKIENLVINRELSEFALQIKGSQTKMLTGTEFIKNLPNMFLTDKQIRDEIQAYCTKHDLNTPTIRFIPNTKEFYETFNEQYLEERTARSFSRPYTAFDYICRERKAQNVLIITHGDLLNSIVPLLDGFNDTGKYTFNEAGFIITKNPGNIEMNKRFTDPEILANFLLTDISKLN
jgi:broad specificity phosphatase PhoE